MKRPAIADPTFYLVNTGNAGEHPKGEGYHAAGPRAGAVAKGPNNSPVRLAALAVALSSVVGVAQLKAGPDVLTSRNDHHRSGVQRSETILTPANVSSSFGLVNTLAVDGQVYAQPLYVSAANAYVNGAPQGQKNLLIVATEHDSVYCFDADDGTVYWQRSLLPNGETPTIIAGCDDLQPENGITGTPVIDRNKGPNGTIFVVSWTQDGSGSRIYRLNALDLGTGQPTLGPAVINASFPGNGPGANGSGMVTFLPSQERQRMGLGLANGNIYIGFSSICDAEPFAGWMLAYSEHSLNQVAAFDADPNGIPASSGAAHSSGGGIWQAGVGPVIDSGSKSVIFSTGNGPFDANSADYGDSLLRLDPRLNVKDVFTPANQAQDQLDDADLGSGGGTLFSFGGRSLMAVSGKDGNLYLLDLTQPWAQPYQEIDGANPGGVYGNAAYFNRSLFYGPAQGTLHCYAFNNAGTLVLRNDVSSTTYGFPGTIPSISANGSRYGIVWTIEVQVTGSTTTNPAILHAYSAYNLTQELYRSTDAFGDAVKFSVPTIANGKVYVPTKSSVGVFGLR